MILCAAPVEVYDRNMANNPPAVIPASAMAQGSSADLLPMPAGAALPAPWLALAAPMLPQVGRGAARALVTYWIRPPDVPREVGLVAVHLQKAK